MAITTILCAITSNAATATLLVGQSYQTEISASGYHYITVESVTSSNPSVSVTQMGLVVKATINSYFPGETVVTCRLRYQLYAGQSYQSRTHEFTLACNETSVSLSPSSISMHIGETAQLTYGFNRPTYVSPQLQWTSSDDNIVTIGSTGMLTAMAEGNATIYLRSNLGSNTAQCTVNVSATSGSGSGNPESSDSDTAWYNETDSEFEISTVAQMLGFRQLVNQGEHFRNKTVRLIKDIDLTAYNWTTPISNYPNVFEGIFDGDGHSLTIYIDKVESGTQEYYYFGFFGNNWGTIRNLTLKGSVKVDIAGMITYGYIGALCGTSNKLESCVNEASLTFTRSYVKSTGNSDRIGGLAGNCARSIINCINRGNIITHTKYSTKANTNDYHIGGITGYCNETTGCMNMGSIINETAGDSDYGMLREYIGGITGWCVSSEIRRCSNLGSITGNSKFSGIGGIIGGSGGGTKCTDSYVGKCSIRNNRGGSAAYVNSICGQRKYSNETFTNNYSASDITFYNQNRGEAGNTQYSSTQMQTTKFADKLGSTYWLGADGLYPVVKGSPDEYNYYISEVSDITCNSASITTNIPSILGTSVRSWGLLLTLDDGIESYFSGTTDDYVVSLTDLVPDRSYKIRWYAQNLAGKEYYGVFATFTTKPLSPTTCETNTLGVSSAELTGQSYISHASKYGFFIRKNDNLDPGKYYWGALTSDIPEFKLLVSNLEGSTTYSYTAVIELDGIIYAGEELTFVTKSIMTLDPSDFTHTNVTLNGELSSGFDDFYFEFRPYSLPSVIASDIISANREGSRIMTTSPELTLNESYKYRIVAVRNSETYYGDWVEFLFDGEAGIETATSDEIDMKAPVIVYDLSGQIVFHGMMSDLHLKSGIYIVRQNNNVIKIRL